MTLMGYNHKVEMADQTVVTPYCSCLAQMKHTVMFFIAMVGQWELHDTFIDQLIIDLMLW
jgi:hypothetical protein